MSYNAILQNSPALNSLKRPQLVNLCKRHALKASGKNVDLIERLKEHGSGLPPESLDYRWEVSDDGEETNEFTSPTKSPTPHSISTRPSEQWEMVMDDIPEADENGKAAAILLSGLRTPGKTGELGTAGSKSGSKFSLKNAITNSLGLKRSAVNGADEQSSHGGPFDFPDSPSLEPIPGTSAKPGTPAPANARLSTGTQPGLTTTIRLISTSAESASIPTPPRIAPFQTAFDLEMTPGTSKRPVWPASPATTQKSGRLYPIIPSEDLMPTPFKSNFGTPGPALRMAEATPAKSPFPTPVNNVDDIFSPAKPAASAKHAEKKEVRLSMPNNQPYLFGSPIAQPQFSPGKFDAAASSVLEEMNKRLAEAGVQKVEKTVLGSIDKAKAGAASADHRAKVDRNSGADRFAKAHEEVFSKMDSITNHYAARRPPAAAANEGPATGKKRKSDAAGLGRGPAPAPETKRKSSVAGTRVPSTTAQKKINVPGGLEEEDVQEDADVQRSSKRIRINENEDIHKGKRPSLSGQKTEEEIKKQEREREATRRHLDAARRRSSRGRLSLGVKGVAPSPKKPRVGILGAAKALVRNVWNMGSGSKPAPTKPVSKPATAPERSKSAQSMASSTSTSTIGRNSQSVASKSTAASLARARSPAEAARPSTLAPRPAGSAAPPTLKPRSVSSTSNRPKPALASAGASSIGGRTNVSGPSKASSTTKPHISGEPQGQSSEAAKADVSPRKRTFSTLMRPTASSMAKKASSVSGATSRVLSPSSLRQNTFSPNAPASKIPSPKTSIFTKPVSAKNFGSPVRAGADQNNQNMASLGTAAEAMLEGFAKANTNAKPALSRQSSIAHKPGMQRSKLIAKASQQRASVAAATAGGSAGVGASSSIPRPKAARSRSSMGATPKKAIGVMKNQRMSVGGEALRMKARQSEYARRKSRVATAETGAAMEVDA